MGANKSKSSDESKASWNAIDSEIDPYSTNVKT